ncbi:DUF2845 domain-containing protein [Iodobacter sp.]|uniref:DUF2845 domain-containing protein n=1 Tax=Iodobacter sp. TaxID=1915058 RepID=UPI0025F50F0A|nr:DUF2845 domain-containing protein [Iodobacter sp.]
MKYLISLCFFASMTAQADSMRCGQQLVSSGDPIFAAEAKCGAPMDKREYSMPAIYINSKGDKKTDPNKAPIFHQEWTYNFGSDRLMMKIKAIDNKISTIETLGYGH